MDGGRLQGHVRRFEERTKNAENLKDFSPKNAKILKSIVMSRCFLIGDACFCLSICPKLTNFFG